MRARQAVVVVDLGFGDAGKGTITDYLARDLAAHTVVRFNGGAQAGHNVVAPDGRHHTFAQFGAGTFVEGVRTHLSRHMVLHPTALLVEARHLERAGVRDPLACLTVSDEALVITPFQQCAGRLRELARGDGRHGSCGVGVGETVGDEVAGHEAVRARHLGDPAALRVIARRVQARKRAELDEALRALEGVLAADAERALLDDDAMIDRWVDALAPWRERSLVVPDAHLRGVLEAPGAVVFEGAQGVLLDEWRGFHPYTTWSTCTFENALALLREHASEAAVTRLGVLRAYATRHGPGPFPTEDAALRGPLREPHNPEGAWQGGFRVGWPDAVLARYAIEACGGVDALALTHLDRARDVAGWRACRGYRDLGEHLALGPPRDLEWQASLTRALMAAEPLYEGIAVSNEDPEEGLVRYFEGAIGARVAVTSSGPRAGDKRRRDAR